MVVPPNVPSTGDFIVSSITPYNHEIDVVLLTPIDESVDPRLTRSWRLRRPHEAKIGDPVRIEVRYQPRQQER
jgi:hypothetical protein